jgi:hypothetical protein
LAEEDITTKEPMQRLACQLNNSVFQSLVDVEAAVLVNQLFVVDTLVRGSLDVKGCDDVLSWGSINIFWLFSFFGHSFMQIFSLVIFSRV